MFAISQILIRKRLLESSLYDHLDFSFTNNEPPYSTWLTGTLVVFVVILLTEHPPCDPGLQRNVMKYLATDYSPANRRTTHTRTSSPAAGSSPYWIPPPLLLVIAKVKVKFADKNYKQTSNHSVWPSMRRGKYLLKGIYRAPIRNC